MDRQWKQTAATIHGTRRDYGGSCIKPDELRTSVVRTRWGEARHSIGGNFRATFFTNSWGFRQAYFSRISSCAQIYSHSGATRYILHVRAIHHWDELFYEKEEIIIFCHKRNCDRNISLLRINRTCRTNCCRRMSNSRLRSSNVSREKCKRYTCRTKRGYRVPFIAHTCQGRMEIAYDRGGLLGAVHRASTLDGGGSSLIYIA